MEVHASSKPPVVSYKAPFVLQSQWNIPVYCSSSRVYIVHCKNYRLVMWGTCYYSPDQIVHEWELEKYHYCNVKNIKKKLIRFFLVWYSFFLPYLAMLSSGVVSSVFFLGQSNDQNITKIWPLTHGSRMYASTAFRILGNLNILCNLNPNQQQQMFG